MDIEADDIDYDQWERAFTMPPRYVSLVVSLLASATAFAVAPPILSFFASPSISPSNLFLGQLLIVAVTFPASYVQLRLQPGSVASNLLLIALPVLTAYFWFLASDAYSGQDRAFLGGLFVVLIFATGVPLAVRAAYLKMRVRILEAAWDELALLPPPRQPWAVGQRHRQLAEKLSINSGVRAQQPSTRSVSTHSTDQRSTTPSAVLFLTAVLGALCLAFSYFTVTHLNFFVPTITLLVAVLITVQVRWACWMLRTGGPMSISTA